jgi:hypothetical protein
LRTEREEITSLTLTQDAEAEARVAELVEETPAPDLGQDEEIEHRTDLARATRGGGQGAAEIAAVSEPVPEGEMASDAGSGQEMTEPEAELGLTGAVLESVLARNNLGTEEVTSMSAMHADICPHLQVATDIGRHAQMAAVLAQAMAYNAHAMYTAAGGFESLVCN